MPVFAPIVAAALPFLGKVAVGLGVTAAAAPLLAGLSHIDQSLFGGGVTRFFGSAIGHVTREVGKEQQKAIKDVELATFGKHIDNWGKGLASVLEGTPLQFISDWLRKTGQDIMGVPANQREYGTAANPRGADTDTTRPDANTVSPTVAPSTPTVTIASATTPDTPAVSNVSWRVPDTGTRAHTVFADVAPDIDRNTLRASHGRLAYFTPAPVTGALDINPVQKALDLVDTGPAPTVTA